MRGQPADEGKGYVKKSRCGRCEFSPHGLHLRFPLPRVWHAMVVFRQMLDAPGSNRVRDLELLQGSRGHQQEGTAGGLAVWQASTWQQAPNASPMMSP